MKHPKLKNATLCQILLYSPVLFFIIVGFGLGFIFQNIGIICAISVIAGFILALAYLLCLFPLFLLSDMMFAAIRYWEKNRLYYTTNCNGTKRDEALHKILKRANRYGKKINIDTSGIKPDGVFYKRKASQTIYWAAIEKITMVYTVDFLDEKTYRHILSTSNSIAVKLKCKKENLRFLDKNQKNAPIATSVAVIILTNYAAPDIPQLVCKSPDFKETALLPCVADFSAKRYYFDGMKETYIMGTEGTPVKNYTINQIKKVVFKGKLPLKNNNNYDPDFDFKDKLDKTLWYYIKEYIVGMTEATKEEKKNVKRNGKRMKDGEILYEDEIIYLKSGERLASFGIMTDDDNKNLVTVLSDDYWSYPNKLKISKKDKANLKQRLKAFLEKKGLTVEFGD